MARILIAEEEAPIASFLSHGLQANGHSVATADDGIKAVSAARDTEFDLMILGKELSGNDGLAVLKEVRKLRRRLPVLMLTTRDAVTDIVAGLDAGADDCIAKPFSFDELLARINARLRAGGHDETAVIEAGPLSLDLRRRLVYVDARPVELSAREFALAEMFLTHPGHVLSREQLLSSVWGYDFEPTSNVVDVYVGYLRKKIGAGRIETVRRMGYRLRVH